MYIKDYSKIVELLVKLTRLNTLFAWEQDQQKAMDSLKKAVVNSPALRPLKLDGKGEIGISIDTSWKAVGFIIYQIDEEDPTRRHYARFGSITLNEREARFSQPKRELYGLLRALKVCQYWLIGVCNLVVETDAQYIKGMLNNPGMGPNATINRWIEDILMFHFMLRHIQGATFPANGLSRRDPQPGDEVYPDLERMDLEDHGPLKFETAPGTTTAPKDLEDFKHEIDTRGGYLLATGIADFEKELEKARLQEQDYRDLYLAQEVKNENICQFLNNTPLIPDLEDRFDKSKAVEYLQDHRTSSGKAQDECLPLVRIWLKNPRFRPEDFNEKQYTNFKQYCCNFFLDKEDRLYRRNIEGFH